MTTAKQKTIAGFAAHLAPVACGGIVVPLWQVADLEAHVDRHALLAGDDPDEPPYWAHLWSGAHVLASVIPARAGRVIEIGCGLGLPGLVAARQGSQVVFMDREAAPLAFVRESIRDNRVDGACCVAGDFARPSFRAPFDLVLAAEIVYDRAGFDALASALAALAGSRGRVLLTDGRRIDTRDFYPALDRAGLAWSRQAVRVDEEGVPVDLWLVEARRR